MIQQFQLTLNALEGVRIPQAWAYRLYGWLMSQISSEFGDQMHLQGEHPHCSLPILFTRKESFVLDDQLAE